MSAGSARSNSRLLSATTIPRGTIFQSEKSQRRINLNVGGERHSPYVSTLKNVPDSPLAWIIREEYKAYLDYDSESDSFFFDRHPGIFSQVLNYFQTGKLHCPRDVCGPMFQAELHYWGIDETQMEACCWPNYTAHREIQENLRLFSNGTVSTTRTSNKEKDLEEGAADVSVDLKPASSKWNRYQRKIWEILDEPYSSKTAKIFAYVSLGIIVLSIITFSMMTMGSLTNITVCERQNKTVNATQSTKNTSSREYETNTSLICAKKGTDILKVIKSFELLFAFWFTAELAFRFIFCPDKLGFMKTFSNWVDLSAIVPVYLLVLAKDPSDTIMILNMARYVRILRFLKLLYDLHILGKTLQASMNQLVVMVLILCVPALIFSCIVYFTELYFGNAKSKEDFADIPKALWWSIVTMTTVGYGSVTPISALGRVFGGFAAVIGILIVSMTASVIGSSFQQYYQVARTQLKIPTKNRKGLNLDNESTLLGLLRAMDKKAASIKSDDSKDSGYGNSPIPPPVEAVQLFAAIPQESKQHSVIVSTRNRNRLKRTARRETALI